MTLIELMSPEWAAVFISLVALSLAIYEGRATRRHYRIMSRPQVDIGVEWNRTDKGQLELIVLLTNAGPGTAAAKTIDALVEW